MKSKSIFLILALVSFFGCEPQSYGAMPGLKQGKVVSRDSSSTNIPTTYTTGAGIGSSLSGYSHVKVINKSSTDVAVAFSTVTNCVGASDNDVVLATAYAVEDNFGTNSVVCVRSLGSTISSGLIYIVLW